MTTEQWADLLDRTRQRATDYNAAGDTARAAAARGTCCDIERILGILPPLTRRSS